MSPMLSTERTKETQTLENEPRLFTLRESVRDCGFLIDDDLEDAVMKHYGKAHPAADVDMHAMIAAVVIAIMERYEIKKQ